MPLGRGYRRSEGGWLVPPPTIVPRGRIVGIDERCDRTGSVVRKVEGDEVAAAAEHLVRACGVDSLVVSFLWAFRNPSNEVQAAAIAAQAYPSLPVTAASQLSPVIREYERTQLALLNASVAGSLDWLEPLEDELRELGFRRRLLLTHSNGGVVGAPYAKAVPIGLVQSGPAAGAAASSQLVGSLEEPGAVTCDMGGTSLDVALIMGDTPLLRSRGRVMEQWTCLPMVDVDSVGAGGGSIAWADALGGLRVGPRSAGADPGPACYGRGGTDPTVTDALLILGYIDPHRFLGGRMALDTRRAHEACDHLGTVLGLSAEEVAWGIREIALARMTKAVRNRLATRGLAASDLALIAFGGCGPLLGAEIAAHVGTRRCVIPALASVFSAYGAATSPLRRQRSASVVRPMPIADRELQALCEELSAQALADLDEGAAVSELRSRRTGGRPALRAAEPRAHRGPARGGPRLGHLVGPVATLRRRVLRPLRHGGAQHRGPSRARDRQGDRRGAVGGSQRRRAAARPRRGIGHRAAAVRSTHGQNRARRVAHRGPGPAMGIPAGWAATLGSGARRRTGHDRVDPPRPPSPAVRGRVVLDPREVP